MAMKDLNALENRLYQYILSNDFESNAWVTARVARDLGISEQEVYSALSELTKKIRENIWVFYRSGELHVVAE